MRVSCFGDKFSHTHAAAAEFAKESGLQICDFSYFDSVYETLLQVKEGKCETAVVPMENSFEGTVAATEDALGELRLYIVRETVMPVRQNLIVKEGVKLEDVKTVYSHPQALAQCRASLDKLVPYARRSAVAYTSAGLDMLDNHSAAIARTPKAGQIIAREGIEDSSENCTRFVTVKAAPKFEGDKISIMFSVGNTPGALLGILELLKERGLNMTKIESRPAKKRLGQYVFFVDFVFGGDYGEMQKFLAILSDATDELRFLGRYPQYEL